MKNNAAPNVHWNLFTKLTSLLVKYSAPNVIIGGDWNCVLDGKLDKHPSNLSTIPTRRQKAIRQMLDEVGLIDAWHLLNPDSTDYTFYSNPHKSYSRIDFFLVPQSSIEQIEKCSIGSIHIPDHAPVFLGMHISYNQSNRYNWKCNRSILSNPVFCSMAQKELEMFIQENDNEYTNPSNVWETTKAYLRGIIISYCSAKKKNKLKEQKRLELELQKAESEHKRNGCNANWHKVIRTRTALNILLSQNAEKGLFRQKHKIYKYANRSGKYLANLIGNKSSNKSIDKIKDKNGKLHYTNIEIANVFNEFSSLYTSKTVGMDDKIFLLLSSRFFFFNV